MKPREFLIGWLMEFGSGRVSQEALYSSDWYMGETNDIDVDCQQEGVDSDLGGEFIRVGKHNRTFTITKAGLDFIKGETHEHQYWQ